MKGWYFCFNLEILGRRERILYITVLVPCGICDSSFAVAAYDEGVSVEFDAVALPNRTSKFGKL